MLINHPLSDTQHTAGVHGKFSGILISKRYLAKCTFSLLMIYISEGKLKSLLCCSTTLCDTELVTYTVNRLRWEPHFSTIVHFFFIGPESDHWEYLSLTNSLTNSLLFSKLD